MSFTNLSFLGIYFPLLLMAYYNPIFKSNSFRKFILLSASIGLYTFCEPTYAPLLIGVIVVNYLLVKLSDRFNKNIFRGGVIAVDISILLLFKYIHKFLGFGLLGESISQIVFPIGLSYFIFKAISYVVDSKEYKHGNIIDVALYIANFLTIVSGPLSTYADELPSIREKKKISWELAYKGMERLMIGLAKKVIIADSLSVLVTRCFASSELSLVMAWVGAIGYTLQLFFDFSGYTDMAIGVGCLFGFNLPENFNCPYMATSISDFWKKWHISLTKWFTKYLYIPLGGSRVKTVGRHIFNLFVVWLATGMWHGSSMTFIVWAMIYFVFQMLEKYTNIATAINKIHLGHIYTMLIVIIEWVIFRSESVATGFAYIKSMFLLNGNAFVLSADLLIIVKYMIPLILGLVFSTDIGTRIKSVSEKNTILNGVYNLGLTALFVICLVISIGQGYSAPLYAGF